MTTEQHHPYYCASCGAEISRNIRHSYYDFDYYHAEPETMVMSAHCGECSKMLSFMVNRTNPDRRNPGHALLEMF